MVEPSGRKPSLSGWHVTDNDATRSLPSSPRSSERGMEHQDSGKGSAQLASDRSLRSDPPAPYESDPGTNVYTSSPTQPEPTTTTANHTQPQPLSPLPDPTAFASPIPPETSVTALPPNEDADNLPASPMSHDYYSSQAVSPEPFTAEIGSIPVTALGMPQSAAWPPAVDTETELITPLNLGQETDAEIFPEQALDKQLSRASSSRASTPHAELSTVTAPQPVARQAAEGQWRIGPGGVKHQMSLGMKTFNPIGLEDMVVRPEQLPQLKAAPGLRRVLSVMPAGQAAAGLQCADKRPPFIPPTTRESPGSSPGGSPVHTPPLPQTGSASAGGAIPSRQLQLAGGSLVHQMSRRDRHAGGPPPRASPLGDGSSLVSTPLQVVMSQASLQGPPQSQASQGSSNLYATPGRLMPMQQRTALSSSSYPSRVDTAELPQSSRMDGVPMALLGQEGSGQHIPGIPMDGMFGGFPMGMPLGSQGGNKGSAIIVPPKPLYGGFAMPFGERKGSSGPPARAVGRAPSGNVVKTAGRSNKSRENTAMPDAHHPPDQASQQESKPPSHTKGAGTPEQPSTANDTLDGLAVRGMSTRDGDYHHNHGLPSKTRRKGPGRINFKSLRPLPQALSAGASGLEVGKLKEGLARRMLAAEQHTYGAAVFKRKNERPPPTPDGIMMDGFVLLEAGDDEMPQGIVAARLSGRHINSVEEADLAYFVGLRVLDLSDNHLPGMAVLTPLRALQALSLSLNRMNNLGQWDSGLMFQDLVTLDLSYNKLNTEGLFGENSCLATLPTLRELNVSGNMLTTLPSVMGPFTSLELLKLADNRLTGHALPALAALPALTSLNISRNPTMQGIIVNMEALLEPTPEGYNPADVLTAAGLSLSRPSFPSLRILDLSNCNITDTFLVEPLRVLPSIIRLALGGNPLAITAMQVTRREEQKRAKAALLAADGAILPPGALKPAPEDPLLLWQPVASQGPKPTVASVLAGGGGRFLAVKEPMGRREAERAAALAAVAAVPEEAVGAAFERVDAAIEAWQLNTVPEGEEEEEEEYEEEGPLEEDMTFLTGVGITEKVSKRPAEVAIIHATLDPPLPSDRPLWEDVDDPTERLALALGLDPTRLAVYTRRLTQDALGSANALRFALSHPLVEADEGIGAAPTHLALTATARAKRRDRPVKLLPLAAGHATSTIPIPPDGRTIKIQTVEDMLSTMRSRLASLETTLTQRLATVPAVHLAELSNVASGMDTGGGAERTGLDMAADGIDPFAADDEDRPESPKREASPFQPRGVVRAGPNDDAASDMSALPDDVMEQIENSDPSEGEEAGMDGASSEEEEEDNTATGQGNGPASPGSPGARARTAGSGLTVSIQASRVWDGPGTPQGDGNGLASVRPNASSPGRSASARGMQLRQLPSAKGRKQQQQQDGLGSPRRSMSQSVKARSHTRTYSSRAGSLATPQAQALGYA